MYDGAAVYHEETQSLYFTGGRRSSSEKRVQRYSLESGYWYHLGLKPGSSYNASDLLVESTTHFQSDLETRKESSAVVIDDKIIVFGGSTLAEFTFNETDNVCVSPYAQVFDVACEKWTQVLPTKSLARTSHGMIQRQNALWIFGIRVFLIS
jgi:hypothetical protein